MSASLPRLVATSVTYYHENDERAFFEWLDRIPCVQDYHGVLHDLIIELSRLPTDYELRELLGFCERYEIEKAQLAQFLTDENSHWFGDPEMYWVEEVFGAPKDE